jgi:hypothetical protein
MRRIRILGLSGALGLLLAQSCASLDEYDGPVTVLDLGLCSQEGDFTLESSNPYFPIEVGKQWILEGGGERVQITVLDETKVVAGVTTRVIEEREWEGGEMKEVSRNFFAQAADGTVCYFGEDVEMYKDGELVSREGEWNAGDPGSQPGIIMPANPTVGMKFQMEVAPGAGDEGLIVAVGETATVPAGTFPRTIRVREIDPKDNEQEDKLFAAGVGFLVDEDMKLVSY